MSKAMTAQHEKENKKMYHAEFGVVVRHLLNNHEFTLGEIGELSNGAVLVSWIDVWDSTAEQLETLTRLHENLNRFLRRWEAGGILIEGPHNVPIHVRRFADNLYLECGERVWDAAERPEWR